MRVCCFYYAAKSGDAEQITVFRGDFGERVRLLAQLNEKDKVTVMNIIDTMLTKQKFQNFFEQNLKTAKS